MSFLILSSPYDFPVAAIAGAIHVGLLPKEYDSDKLWSLNFIQEHKKFSHARPIYLGKTLRGEKVVSISASTKPFMLTGIIETFLNLHGFSKEQYRLVDVHIPGRHFIMVGKTLLGVPLLQKIGRIIINYQIKRFYHHLNELIPS